jgi:serine/threonine protein kinase
LERIENQAFSALSSWIVIPSTILFVAFDAIYIPFQISLTDSDSCPEFDRWLELRRSEITIDFRRIQRVGSGLSSLGDYLVNLSGFEEGSLIESCDRSSAQLYRRAEDQLLIIVKSILLSTSVERSQIENEIENLLNLRHPCIAAPIGFVFPAESAASPELKLVRLHVDGPSLSEVISVSPEWWTATAKAKAVAGIVLGLRFAHSLGLVHGRLNSRNILFDEDHRIQITDFHPIRLEMRENENKGQIGGFSGERWTQKTDLCAFSSVLFEIVVGQPVNDSIFVPTSVPPFVLDIIEAGLWSKSELQSSFHDIFETLNRFRFHMTEGIDDTKVSVFLKWVESVEQSMTPNNHVMPL